jgi:hypothetical protein
VEATAATADEHDEHAHERGKADTMTHEQRTTWHAVAIAGILAYLLWREHGHKLSDLFKAPTGLNVPQAPQAAAQMPVRGY